ncbi:MAG: 30S ribosomal protein S17 [Dehalococcoidia bacterium]
MNNRRTLVGTVISNRMDKTVVVKVTTRRPHLRYKKYINHTKKYKAHDKDGSCQVGDKVKMIETRPLSKEKRWRVGDILERRE